MAKIAVVTDSHDQLETLGRAVDAAEAAGADVLLHTGDLCAPFMVKLLGERFQGPVHIVFGNNDADGRLFQVMANKFPQITLHGIYSEIEVAGARVAMIHYPEPALRIAQSGKLDLVCYGHDHTRHLEQVGHTWLLNPGEILGLWSTPAWALYDTERHTVEIFELPRG